MKAFCYLLPASVFAAAMVTSNIVQKAVDDQEYLLYILYLIGSTILYCFAGCLLLSNLINQDKND